MPATPKPSRRVAIEDIAEDPVFGDHGFAESQDGISREVDPFPRPQESTGGGGSSSSADARVPVAASILHEVHGGNSVAQAASIAPRPQSNVGHTAQELRNLGVHQVKKFRACAEILNRLCAAQRHWKGERGGGRAGRKASLDATHTPASIGVYFARWKKRMQSEDPLLVAYSNTREAMGSFLLHSIKERFFLDPPELSWTEELHADGDLVAAAEVEQLRKKQTAAKSTILGSLRRGGFHDGDVKAFFQALQENNTERCRLYIRMVSGTGRGSGEQRLEHILTLLHAASQRISTSTKSTLPVYEQLKKELGGAADDLNDSAEVIDSGIKDESAAHAEKCRRLFSNARVLGNDLDKADAVKELKGKKKAALAAKTTRRMAVQRNEDYSANIIDFREPRRALQVFLPSSDNTRNLLRDLKAQAAAKALFVVPDEEETETEVESPGLAGPPPPHSNASRRLRRPASFRAGTEESNVFDLLADAIQDEGSQMEQGGRGDDSQRLATFPSADHSSVFHDGQLEEAPAETAQPKRGPVLMVTAKGLAQARPIPVPALVCICRRARSFPRRRLSFQSTTATGSGSAAARVFDFSDVCCCVFLDFASSSPHDGSERRDCDVCVRSPNRTYAEGNANEVEEEQEDDETEIDIESYTAESFWFDPALAPEEELANVEAAVADARTKGLSLLELLYVRSPEQRRAEKLPGMCSVIFGRTAPDATDIKEDKLMNIDARLHKVVETDDLLHHRIVNIEDENGQKEPRKYTTRINAHGERKQSGRKVAAGRAVELEEDEADADAATTEVHLCQPLIPRGIQTYGGWATATGDVYRMLDDLLPLPGALVKDFLPDEFRDTPFTFCQLAISDAGSDEVLCFSQLIKGNRAVRMHRARRLGLLGARGFEVASKSNPAPHCKARPNRRAKKNSSSSSGVCACASLHHLGVSCDYCQRKHASTSISRHAAGGDYPVHKARLDHGSSAFLSQNESQMASMEDPTLTLVVDMELEEERNDPRNWDVKSALKKSTPAQGLQQEQQGERERVTEGVAEVEDEVQKKTVTLNLVDSFDSPPDQMNGVRPARGNSENVDGRGCSSRHHITDSFNFAAASQSQTAGAAASSSGWTLTSPVRAGTAWQPPAGREEDRSREVHGTDRPRPPSLFVIFFASAVPARGAKLENPKVSEFFDGDAAPELLVDDLLFDTIIIHFWCQLHQVHIVVGLCVTVMKILWDQWNAGFVKCLGSLHFALVRWFKLVTPRWLEHRWLTLGPFIDSIITNSDHIKSLMLSETEKQFEKKHNPREENRAHYTRARNCVASSWFWSMLRVIWGPIGLMQKTGHRLQAISEYALSRIKIQDYIEACEHLAIQVTEWETSIQSCIIMNRARPSFCRLGVVLRHTLFASAWNRQLPFRCFPWICIYLISQDVVKRRRVANLLLTIDEKTLDEFSLHIRANWKGSLFVIAFGGTACAQLKRTLIGLPHAGVMTTGDTEGKHSPGTATQKTLWLVSTSMSRMMNLMRHFSTPRLLQEQF
eukprot:g10913.t1